MSFLTEDLFGSTLIGVGTEVSVAAQLAIFRGEAESGGLGASGGRRAESREPERAISVREAFARYLDSTQAAPATRVEYATTLAKYQDWVMAPQLRARLADVSTPLASAASGVMAPPGSGPVGAKPHRSVRPERVRDMTRESLREFLDWVHLRALEGDAGNPGRTANKVRGNLSAVLNWASEQDLLDSIPKLPKKRDQVDVAGQYYLDEAEINRLYWATSRLQLRGWIKTHAPLAAYWRAALVFFYNYGVDTGTVFAYLPRHEPLLWRHVSFETQCPDRQQRIESEFGWLYYVRTKTGRKFVRPMNRAVCLHLKALLPAGVDPSSVRLQMADDAVFRGGSNRPSDMFSKLCRLAKLPAKEGFGSASTSPWMLKDLRKTSATWHDVNVPGAASAVLGHALDGSAAVTGKHYSNSNPLAAKSIMTLPQPAAFRSIWDDSIHPPDQ